jgi:ATP-dependent helicase/nuclease subunit B
VIERLRAELPQVFEEQWRREQAKRRTEVGTREVLAKERMLRRLQEFFESEAEAWLTQGLPLVPRYLEWVFGMEYGPERDPHSQVEPVTVGGLKFRGQIDRIDAAGPNAFFLVDYKSKGTKAMPKAIEQGIDFQLPVYLKVAEQVLFGKGTAVGGAYFSIEKADRTTGALVKAEHLQDLGMGKKRLKLGREEWEALLAESESTLRRYREQMADGQFQVAPRDVKVCDHCEYRKACRYDRLRALKGEKSDGETGSTDR